jgi:acyl phosphate:glycerol-3-phosphate acyltransferase
MVFEAIIFVITYLICSISPSIEICKIKKGQDIRDLGSGNAGTTNSIRVLGKFLGIVVFILDILKVVVSYYLIYFIAYIFKQDFDVTVKSFFTVAAVIGHCYPIYYGFKGGKGIVTILVTAFYLNYQIAIVCIISAIIIIIITRTVSIGSLSGIILYNIMGFVMSPEYILPIFIVSAIAMFKHRKNIIRIMNKEENKLF